MRWRIKGSEIKQPKLKPRVINCKSVVMLCNIIMYFDLHTRVGTLIAATIYLQLIQNR